MLWEMRKRESRPFETGVEGIRVPGHGAFMMRLLITRRLHGSWLRCGVGGDRETRHLAVEIEISPVKPGFREIARRG